MIEEIKEDVVVKENSEEISIPLPRAQARNLEKKTVLPMYLFHVPSSTTRYFLINHIPKFKKDNGGCSSIECYLFVNSVNILNLIDLIGKCPECNSNVILNLKIKKGLCHQFQISCCKCEWSELMETSKTLNNNKKGKQHDINILSLQLLPFEKSENDTLHWSHFVI